jgi:hypothetical protein
LEQVSNFLVGHTLDPCEKRTGWFRGLVPRTLLSVFVEVEDSGISQILRFSGFDEDDLSWKPIRVRQVNVTVLDHGSIRGIEDGIVELVFDLVEIRVSHSEALLGDPIIIINQSG